ncbi:MAG: serine hydrolase [Planctomycetota bacterium]|nr:serine hydrolase [Planctomycetota bacterium]
MCFRFPLTLVALMLLSLVQQSTYAADLPTVVPEQVGLSAERLALVRPAIQTVVDEGRVPGAVVMVCRRGKVALVEAVGWRDIENEKPMERDTVFRIYSMTKPITSVAVLMLVERGQIDLDAPVERYLPELADRKVLSAVTGELEPARRAITTRDLLRHTSGMTYGFYGKSTVDQQYLRTRVLNPERPLSEMLIKLRDLPLVSQPGERFEYSVSVDVLGRLVEVVSEKRFDEFLATNLFEPLGMNDTGFHVAEGALSRFANNYAVSEQGKLRILDRADKSHYRHPLALLSGGGGLVSTADDYMRFCQMLLAHGEFEGKRYLRPETVLVMTSNQLMGGAYPISISGDVRHGVGFGLGVSVICEKIPGAGYVPLGEYGWGGAASTHFWISPKDDLAVVALTQVMPFSLRLEGVVKPLVYAAIE